MADAPSPPPATTDPGAPDSQTQAWVALAIIAALILIALGSLVDAVILKKWDGPDVAIGAIIACLATALNAPTGIAKVISAAIGSKSRDNITS